MRLSILTVTLNAREHLPGLAESIRRQSAVDLPFEWVVVDGASTDGTVEVIKNYQDLISRWITEPDSGFYDALNKAISIADGDYYLVMGADDRFGEGAFQLIAREVLKYPGNDLYLFGIRRAGRVRHSYQPTGWRLRLGWASFVASHSVGSLIRRDSHKEFGKYSLRYPLLADGAYLLRLAANRSKVHVSNAILGEFAEGGMTSVDMPRIAAETWLIQVHRGAGMILQTMLFLLRVARLSLTKRR